MTLQHLPGVAIAARAKSLHVYQVSPTRTGATREGLDEILGYDK